MKSASACAGTQTLAAQSLCEYDRSGNVSLRLHRLLQPNGQAINWTYTVEKLEIKLGSSYDSLYLAIPRLPGSLIK